MNMETINSILHILDTSLHSILHILDIALAKCQRATIQNKYQLIILRDRVMSCARYFFVVKFLRQLEMSYMVL